MIGSASAGRTQVTSPNSATRTPTVSFDVTRPAFRRELRERSTCPRDSTRMPQRDRGGALLLARLTPPNPRPTESRYTGAQEKQRRWLWHCRRGEGRLRRHVLG